MTTTGAPLFDLLVPASGNGRTHLRAEDTPAVLCKGEGMTRAVRFTQSGIVGAGAATCEVCNRYAEALALTAEDVPETRADCCGAYAGMPHAPECSTR